MDTLQLVNVLIMGALFGIWSKEGFLNLAMKCLFMGLFVVNILRLLGKI